MNRQDGGARIKILHVPGCPNLDRVREAVRRVVARVQVNAIVEELVGEYPSPTLLIDGRDVTGHPLGTSVSCRLDLPTEQQVLATLGVGGGGGEQQAIPMDEEIRTAAFRRLLRSGAPARVEDVATDLGQPVERVQGAVADLGGRGQLQLDQEGRIAGSAGLSVRRDRHQIDIAGRRFWTWCAYDILGIFGALEASGTAHSTSPLSDQPLEVVFVRGRPQPVELVVFRPDEIWRDCCANIYEEWCPNSNFFEGREAALAWAAGRGLTGRVLRLAEASELATTDWEATAGRHPPRVSARRDLPDTGD
jgi:hypothetical protein